MTPGARRPPRPSAAAGAAALRALLEEGAVLEALRALHRALGDVFRVSLGRFRPVVLAGPEASHFALVEARDRLSWRPEGDPVTELLQRGLLVTDGVEHDELRRRLSPPLHKGRLGAYVPAMVAWTDAVSANWEEGEPIEIVGEMRKVALLILMDTLFGHDFSTRMPDLLPDIERVLAYISPGAWLVAPWLPRPGYRRSIRRVDEFLFDLIDERRASGAEGENMLSLLAADPSMSRQAIRDQLLTILIAGHDTSTAQLAWTLVLLARHPTVRQRVAAEVDDVMEGAAPTPSRLEKLDLLPRVLAESLRLYPPIHLGNRIATEDLNFEAVRIPAGSRVVYSIYLTHRDPRHWPDPDRFDPSRFCPHADPGRPAYAYLPFGGGPRNCIGLAFSRVEAQVVISRLLQRFEILELHSEVRQHMGATLEPGPRVEMSFRRRGVSRP